MVSTTRDREVIVLQPGSRGRKSEQASYILLVEDDPPTLRLEQVILEEAGYEVRVVGSGEEALQSLARETPALVMLDIGLPGMDGFTTCERIRESSQVPVMMVSGLSSAEDRARGQSVGATDYVTKPFVTRELAESVNKLIGAATLAPPPAVDPASTVELPPVEQGWTSSVPVEDVPALDQAASEPTWMPSDQVVPAEDAPAQDQAASEPAWMPSDQVVPVEDAPALDQAASGPTWDSSEEVEPAEDAPAQEPESRLAEPPALDQEVDPVADQGPWEAEPEPEPQGAARIQVLLAPPAKAPAPAPVVQAEAPRQDSPEASPEMGPEPHGAAKIQILLAPLTKSPAPNPVVHTRAPQQVSQEVEAEPKPEVVDEAPQVLFPMAEPDSLQDRLDAPGLPELEPEEESRATETLEDVEDSLDAPELHEPDEAPVNLSSSLISGMEPEPEEETLAANTPGKPEFTPPSEREVYEGTVRLTVNTPGAVSGLLAFVGELRQNPGFRLLRLVANQSREGMEIWLGLREPLCLETVLLEMDGVSEVQAIQRPDAGDEPVLVVLLAGA